TAQLLADLRKDNILRLNKALQVERILHALSCCLSDRRVYATAFVCHTRAIIHCMRAGNYDASSRRPPVVSRHTPRRRTGGVAILFPCTADDHAPEAFQSPALDHRVRSADSARTVRNRLVGTSSLAGSAPGGGRCWCWTRNLRPAPYPV